MKSQNPSQFSKPPLAAPGLSKRRAAWLPIILWVVSAAAVSFYFRTLPIRVSSEHQITKLRKEAMLRVDNALKRQIESIIEVKVPAATGQTKERLVRQGVAKLLQKNPLQYEKSIQEMIQRLVKSQGMQISSKYLPEADPYYYYELTKNIDKTGSLGKEGEEFKFFNPRRNAPFGNWDRKSWHPYAGYFFYRALKIIKADISLLQACAFYPVFIAGILLLVYGMIARILRVSLLSSWIGALVYMVSPVVLQRSTYGWYDTDLYNLFFSALTFAVFLAAIKRPGLRLLFAFIQGLFLAAFSAFWTGWFYLLPALATASLVLAVWEWWYRLVKWPQSFVWFPAVCFLSTCLFAAWFTTPAGFSWSIGSAFRYFGAVGEGASSEMWPNLMMLVGEAEKVSLEKWLYVSSSHIAGFFSFFGILITGVSVFKKKDALGKKIWLGLLVTYLPMLYVSFRAERFVLMVALPLSLFLAMGLDVMRQFMSDWLGKKLPENKRSLISQGLALVFCGLILPRTVIGADAVSYRAHMYMNDYWNEVLIYLKDNTPEDSMVFSWWPPGYFITAVAERRAFLDGGGQDRTDNFWVSKALMREDEISARGLFRMMSLSGGRAPEFLQLRGYRMDLVVEMILKIVSVDRQAAEKQLPQDWSPEDKEKLLDMTHGKEASPATYLVLYDDLIRQNLIQQVISGWNFERAGTMFKDKLFSLKQLNRLGFDAADEQSTRVLAVVGRTYASEQPVSMSKKKESIGVFENGITVDFDALRAFAILPGTDPPQMEPIDFYHKKDGVWTLQQEPESTRPFVAILIEQDKIFRLVLTHKELIKKLLFRLYYFEGQGMKYFVPVKTSEDLDTGTRIEAFKIDLES